MALVITDRGARDTCLGPAVQLKIHAEDYRPLCWREIWDGVEEHSPGRWAVQVFPPREKLLDSKAGYHLFVLDKEPEGLNLK